MEGSNEDKAAIIGTQSDSANCSPIMNKEIVEIEGGLEKKSTEKQVSPLTPVNKETAATTVQKLYRSYRTRRNLADAAVMAKKFGWWNVIEGALLHQDSATFYAFHKQDSVTNRWSRLRKKAAKVGRGLSKDEKALKLAVQHWLEAVDPRHRYGHNLHIYYQEWMESSTTQPFFYWLDIGEGRNVDLPKCRKSKLQQEQIKYLGPKEREKYEVIIEDGKLVYKESKEFVNTPKGDKWIFVMSTSGRLYVGQKKKGKFQHSSFLAGSATTSAGRLTVTDGVLELMEAYSGHYQPTEENFNKLVNVLKQLGTDLTIAKVQCVSEERFASEEDKLAKSSSMIEETLLGPEETGNEDVLSFKIYPAEAGSNEVENVNLTQEKAPIEDDGSVPKPCKVEDVDTPSLPRKLNRWSSASGARISSLLDVSTDTLNVALKVVDKPLSSPCEVK